MALAAGLRAHLDYLQVHSLCVCVAFTPMKVVRETYTRGLSAIFMCLSVTVMHFSVSLQARSAAL